MASSHGRRLAPDVVALFGPTASGKTAVAAHLISLLDAHAISADSAALYAGLPVLTAAPPYPTDLVGVVPLSESVSVGSYQRLAHAAIDELVAAGRRALVVGGTGLYLRAALSELRLAPPPQPGERERWEEVYDQLGAERAHALLERTRPGRRGAGSRQRPPTRRARRSSSRRPTSRWRPRATSCGAGTSAGRRFSSGSTFRSKSSTGGSRRARHARGPGRGGGGPPCVARAALGHGARR